MTIVEPNQIKPNGQAKRTDGEERMGKTKMDEMSANNFHELFDL